MVDDAFVELPDMASRSGTFVVTQCTDGETGDLEGEASVLFSR